jgi:hypothetical protein
MDIDNLRAFVISEQSKSKMNDETAQEILRIIDNTQDSTPMQAVVSLQKAGLIWDVEDGESERSKLLGQKMFDMKCNKCFSFIGCVTKPSLLEYNFCPKCGRKLIKDDSLLSK